MPARNSLEPAGPLDFLVALPTLIGCGQLGANFAELRIWS
jgi:hypothetical protein